MVLSLSPNSKGEVLVGVGEKVCVIVDDVFRKHHVFVLKNVIAEIDNDLSLMDISCQTQLTIFARSGRFLAAVVNDKFVIVWKRVCGSENIYDNWVFYHKIGF